MISAQGIGRLYRRGGESVAALGAVDLEVASGEMVVVSGPSGSGKSTLLTLLGALDRPTSGRLEVLGVDVAAADAERLTRLRRDDVGFVFQDFRLIGHLGLGDNVALPGLFGPAAHGLEDLGALLEAFGIAHRRRHRPEELSRGEMQRAGLARALYRRPRLLIADEPTASLDAGSSRVLWHLVAEARRARGLTALIATHQPEAVEGATRLVRLKDGEVVSDEMLG